VHPFERAPVPLVRPLQTGCSPFFRHFGFHFRFFLGRFFFFFYFFLSAPEVVALGFPVINCSLLSVRPLVVAGGVFLCQVAAFFLSPRPGKSSLHPTPVSGIPNVFGRFFLPPFVPFLFFSFCSLTPHVTPPTALGA